MVNVCPSSFGCTWEIAKQSRGDSLLLSNLTLAYITQRKHANQEPIVNLQGAQEFVFSLPRD